MPAALIVIALVLVVAIIVALVVVPQRRSARLRGTFGPEYDRTVQTSGDRKAAERELAGRVDRHRQFHVVALSEPARQQYLTEWKQLQAHFVDAPVQSVQAADTLVARVMSDRGYPMAEFDQRAADISVDHADVVDTYRSAHSVCLNSAQGGATTEDLRKAMTEYRALFEKLLGPTREEGTAADGGRQWQPGIAGQTTPEAAAVAGTAPPAAPPAGVASEPPGSVVSR